MRLALDAQTDQARRLLERLRRSVGADLVREILEADQDTARRGSSLQRERVDQLREALRGLDGRAEHRRETPARARRRPRPQGRLDHRRRRLGVRHRVRRPRPRPRLRPQRQHPRPRHRGLLEHRWPGLQGDAARRRREVRGRRQARRRRRTSARSPGPTANVYVAQVSMGGNDAPDGEGAARGRRLARDRRSSSPTAPASPTASTWSKSMTHQKDAVKSGYWPLYRFQPSEVEHGQPFKLDSGDAVDPDRRVRRGRDALRRPPANRPGAGRRSSASWPSRTSTSVGTTTSSWPAMRPKRAPHPARTGDRAAPATGPASRPRRGTRHDRRSPHHATSASSCARRSSPRPRRLTGELDSALALVEAGAGALVLPSLFEEEIIHEEIELDRVLEAGSEAVRRGARLLPGHRGRSPFAGDRYLEHIERLKAAAGVPVIASLNASDAGRLGPLRAPHAGRRRRRARAQPLPPGREPRPLREPTWRPATSPSSPRSARP